MQNTTCTEDRIQHALERCLHGLSRADGSTPTWTAGLCLNYWSLEELVSRDAVNYIFLAEKILEKTREVQENCDYDLLTPLAVIFYFAVLRAPYIPPECDLLGKAFETFHVFLTWPTPYCDVYQEMLSFIAEEQKAPGISFQRLVRAEQGLLTSPSSSSTITVLLVNPAELPKDFLSVTEHLSRAEQSPSELYISLIQHMYQANLGLACDIEKLGNALKSKKLEELQTLYSDLTEVLESAAETAENWTERDGLQGKLIAIGEQAKILEGNTGTSSEAKFQTIPLPVAKCYTYTWDQDNFDVLNKILHNEEALKPMVVSPRSNVNEEEEEEDDDGNVDEEEEIDDSGSHRDSVFSNIYRRYVYWDMPNDLKEDDPMSSISHHSVSFVSSLSSCVDSGYVEDSDESSQEYPEKTEYREERLNHKFKKKLYQFFKSKNHQTKSKFKSDLPPCSSHALFSPFPSLQQTLPLRRAGSLYTPQVRRVPARSKRSQSLPQHALSAQFFDALQNQNVSLKKRPFLSCDEDIKTSTLRVVVFGSDRISGKLARAYSNLRMKESNCPFLTRFFKLQLYYIPVKRSRSSPSTPLTCPESPLKSPIQTRLSSIEDVIGNEESTNDISHYISMMDPWYQRNIQGLMDLSSPVLCQSSKHENNREECKSPILADMLLYYCRFATRSMLLQLYQAEITFHGGMKQTEVFIQSLELGHSAALRAIRASGPGCKRFGIDGDREVIPFTLQIVYSKSAVSGRSRWNNGEKVCTSISFRKACKTYEELDTKMECLDLTVREVVKRQNSKTKQSFNQISISQIKVDKAQIIAQNGGTFPLCLDQDERKILQRVIKCEVSPCYKPGSRDVSRTKKLPWSPASHDQFCSLLCLPIASFSGTQI
ncbi:phosphoinositide 3-kinase regulatory subunit 5 isoform X2 [Spea bombifrons]|uniref:phosphoinositide 3-kinase regulatory subunit 5 isoform X2 n=1 Tax=Spea bombifrons TaxID=233779 RepID=UPI00234AC509|nr:phosphoinositide 3-kinase regulatory subunit 5 isoform X2 [Spea bombifrons]